MKKLFLVLLMTVAFAVSAEPSFEQLQHLIEQRQYSAAIQGLELVLKNHPNSAKAYYSMAQAQAGIGNLEKARLALDKAKGLDPALEFASSNNVEHLTTAITPQVNEIKPVDTGHFWVYLFLFVSLVGAGYYFYRRTVVDNSSDADMFGPGVEPSTPKPYTPSPSSANDYRSPSIRTEAQHQKRYYNTVPQAQPSVVNHYNNTNDGLLTGVLLGSMMHDDSHNTTIIEREVVREQNILRDSSWDNEPTRHFYTQSDKPSSSWDSDSSSSSSSWDSDSSSSSSSWD